MNRIARLLISALIALTLIACNNQMTPAEPLPRAQELKAFEPHRKDFTCKHETDAVPAIEQEADLWNSEGLYVTRHTLWPNQKDWKKAEQLWIKAGARKHWKAMMNLASLYEKGNGEGAYAVEADPYKAALIVEEAMALGIPAAYDKMGNYHAQGSGGIKRNSSRAWAFWELAADMGNPQALTHIGKALAATYDNPEEGFWGNMPIAIKMLECAVAQGYGDAAYELGSTLKIADPEIGGSPVRALQTLHRGVMFGSENAANSLFANFDDGSQIVGNIKDTNRSERYFTLAEALHQNPDLRFPNLDKVLPLPPARLPAWDGNPESLVNAAKSVIPIRPPAPTPGASRTGRAHIPDGHVLTSNVAPPPDEPRHDQYGQLWGSTARQFAHFTGYWLPQITVERSQWQIDWNKAQVPMQFKRGEPLPSMAESIPPGYGTVAWHYRGLPEPAAQAQRHAFIRAGLVREVVVDGAPIYCSAGKRCPQTGIWKAQALPDHSQRSALARQWWRQGFFNEGTQMPDARSWGLDVAGDIEWMLVEPGAWAS